MTTNTETNYKETAETSTLKGADSGSLARGLQVLAVMGDAGRPLTLSEISEAVGLASSTTHRLLQTLSQCDQVYKNVQGRYCLAPRALFPLALDHPLQMLRRDAAETLKSLQLRYGPSVLLIVFLGDKRLLVDFAVGSYSIAPYFDTYITAPLHGSVSGKIMLADMTPQVRDEFLGSGPLTGRTRHTIISRAQLESQLALVAKQGHASNFNENVLGICAIGARITAPSGRALGALVVTGPEEYFPQDKLEEIADVVCGSANRLSTTSMSVRAVARFLNI